MAQKSFAATKFVYDHHRSIWQERETRIVVKDPMHKFDSGGMRVCFWVQEIDEEGYETECVAKFFRRDINDVVCADYLNEAMAQCISDEFAQNYNKLDTPLKISFLSVDVLKINANGLRIPFSQDNFFSFRPTDKPDEIWFNVEPKLSGKFIKYNNNYGETYSDTKQPDMHHDLLFRSAEAFSHFTLQETEGSMLVCDLQGVQDMFTDPQIHTEDGKGLGMGNMGQDGINRWISAHRCNHICQLLTLRPLHAIAPTAQSRSNRYADLHAAMVGSMSHKGIQQAQRQQQPTWQAHAYPPPFNQPQPRPVPQPLPRPPYQNPSSNQPHGSPYQPQPGFNQPPFNQPQPRPVPQPLPRPPYQNPSSNQPHDGSPYQLQPGQRQYQPQPGQRQYQPQPGQRQYQPQPGYNQPQFSQPQAGFRPQVVLPQPKHSPVTQPPQQPQQPAYGTWRPPPPLYENQGASPILHSPPMQTTPVLSPSFQQQPQPPFHQVPQQQPPQRPPPAQFSDSDVMSMSEEQQIALAIERSKIQK